MQRTDVKAAYSGIRNVEPWICVDDLKVRWLAEKRLTAVDPALCSLWLVRRGAGKPSPREEEEARELDDPSATLAAAGVCDGCWLQVRFEEAASRGAPRCYFAEAASASRAFAPWVALSCFRRS